jgi:hypothetical protein
VSIDHYSPTCVLSPESSEIRGGCAKYTQVFRAPEDAIGALKRYHRGRGARSYLPARRAATIDPLETLKVE